MLSILSMSEILDDKDELVPVPSKVASTLSMSLAFFGSTVGVRVISLIFSFSMLRLFHWSSSSLMQTTFPENSLANRPARPARLQKSIGSKFGVPFLLDITNMVFAGKFTLWKHTDRALITINTKAQPERQCQCPWRVALAYRQHDVLFGTIRFIFQRDAGRTVGVAAEEILRWQHGKITKVLQFVIRPDNTVRIFHKPVNKFEECDGKVLGFVNQQIVILWNEC